MNDKKHKTMLSEHFSLEEMTYSRLAVENAIDNQPPPAARQAMGNLVNRLLEPLRQLYDGPIAILSGYRNEAVNRLAGGVAGSQHLKGEAADCYIPEGPVRLLEIVKKSGLSFDQAIVYRKRRFLHLSLKETGHNRMQILFYIFCLIFILPACRARRESMGQEEAFSSDSLVLSGIGVSDIHRMRYTADSMDWNISRLVLTPPDSSGRQYPATITLITGKASGHTTDSAGETHHKVVNATNESIRQSSSLSSQEYEPPVRIWRWWIICGIILFSGLRVLFMIQNKR